MTAEPELKPAAAPKWSRMPGHVRVALDNAIAAHLKTHGRSHYDMLRDDPRFSPWIGSHLGARGEKRLDRYIRAVRRTVAEQSKRRADASSRRSTVLTGLGQEEAEASIDHVGAELATAGDAILSYEGLQSEYRRLLFQLHHALESTLNPDETPRDLAAFLKISSELRAVQRDSAALAKQFHANANSAETVRRFFDRLLATAAAEPQLGPAISQAFAAAMHDQTGLTPTPGD